MNFPNRLELLLWAVLAFPKACKENKNKFSDGEEEISTGLSLEPQSSLWASWTPVGWKLLCTQVTIGEHKGCSPGMLQCTQLILSLGCGRGSSFKSQTLKCQSLLFFPRHNCSHSILWPAGQIHSAAFFTAYKPRVFFTFISGFKKPQRRVVFPDM